MQLRLTGEYPQPGTTVPLGAITRVYGSKFVPPRLTIVIVTKPGTPPKLHRSVSALPAAPNAAGLTGTPHLACPPQRQLSVSFWMCRL
jgi:hypothetical protein